MMQQKIEFQNLELAALPFLHSSLLGGIYWFQFTNDYRLDAPTNSNYNADNQNQWSCQLKLSGRNFKIPAKFLKFLEPDSTHIWWFIVIFKTIPIIGAYVHESNDRILVESKIWKWEFIDAVDSDRNE